MTAPKQEVILEISVNVSMSSRNMMNSVVFLLVSKNFYNNPGSECCPSNQSHLSKYYNQ